MSFSFGFGGMVVGRGRKRTGAVVDLVVDDHVEIFLLRGVSAHCRFRGVNWLQLVVWVRFTFEVCSETSLKVNSLDILAVVSLWRVGCLDCRLRWCCVGKLV
jgi:hypothetical protein